MKKSTPREAQIRQEIISFIRPWAPRSRSELSRHTGFSTATVSRITRRLITGNLLTEADQPGAAVGRPSRRLEINGAYGSVLGISLLPPAVRVLVLNLRGDVLQEHGRPVAWRSRSGSLLEGLKKAIESAVRKLPAGTPRLLGAGLALPGCWDPKEGVSLQYPRVADWKNIPIRKLLEEWTKGPATLIGYGPSLALGEFVRRAGPPSNLVCVEVAENIAMGAIVNGEVLRGAAGNAGELGHLTLGTAGRVCYCGNAGCLETVATCSAVVEEFKQSDAANDLFPNPQSLSYEDVIRLARERDSSFSVRLLARAARTLGEGLAAAVNLFNPEVLVLNGRFFDAGDLVLGPLQSAFHDRALPNMAARLSIERSTIGGRAAALGAGVAALEAALNRL